MKITIFKFLLRGTTWLETKVKAIVARLDKWDKALANKRASNRPEFKSGDDWDWARWGCPDCAGTKILVGPCGGGSMNICCANSACQQAFNNMGPLGTERISNRFFIKVFDPEPEAFGKWQNEA